MGYYTHYTLKSEPNIINTSEFKEKFNEICGDYTLDYVLEEECKWYKNEEHMREVSKNFPEVLFMLTGEGEESGDMWRKYFFNGKMQFCNAIITYEAFDPDKLK
jgi:hypothetical protein